MAFAGLYLWPLMNHWNQGELWGYSTTRSLMASVNMIGWPVALLALLGMLLSLQERTAQNWYWMTCALGWGAATVVLPRVVVYHPEYVFPFALSVMVIAGCAIGDIYEFLATRSKLIGATWIAIACLGSLPSVASHYVDGSRTDMRTAARYVQKNWSAGDRVTGPAMGLFLHYAPGCEPAIPLTFSDQVSQLEKLAAGPGRLWIVLKSGRAGLSEQVGRWLGKHCSHELKVCGQRFDYYESVVDVFLYTPREDVKR